MTHDITATYRLDDVEDDLGPYLFLHAHEQRGDRHLLRRRLDRAVPRSVLPPRHRPVRDVDGDHQYDLLTEVDGVLVLLRSWRAAGDVWASGPDAAAAEAVLREIRDRVPPRPAEGPVPVQFTDEHSGSRHLQVDVRPWSQVRGQYPAQVRTALDQVVEHRPAGDSGRLLLWHGEAGTGKTTAVRALLDAWRGWADGVVVTDPEALLGSGKYLRRVVLDVDDDRWQLVVLEDAETLLHRGAGKGMGKLLNLADGLLGQGLRCLFLITTNEPLGALHPALVRPGRCLSSVEFGRLAAAEATALLGRAVDRPMTLAEARSARPLQVRQPLVAVGQYL